MYPFKNEFSKDMTCTFNENGNSQTTNNTNSGTINSNNRLKFKQMNFEEAMQMMFYKKCPSRPSFKGCSYSNTNKYIYLTLMNANITLESGNNNIVDEIVDENTISVNTNYGVSEFLENDNVLHQTSFYDLGGNEHII